MNPMLVAALTAIVRWAFTFLAGFLVNHAIWSQSDAERYVTAAAIATVTLGFTLWSKYRSRIKLLTALTMPSGSTEQEVEQRLADPLVPNPSVTTKKTDQP